MKEIKHGFLGKYKTYKKVGFEEMPPTTEERAQAIREKLQPWVYDPDKIKIKYGFVCFPNVCLTRSVSGIMLIC